MEPAPGTTMEAAAVRELGTLNELANEEEDLAREGDTLEPARDNA